MDVAHLVQGDGRNVQAVHDDAAEKGKRGRPRDTVSEH